MQLLNNWFFVEAAPNEPRTRKVDFDDAIIIQSIRFVSSNEVGHTLGIRHNFRSSSTAVSYTHLDVYKRQLLYQ